jgi:hypothetical protein
VAVSRTTPPPTDLQLAVADFAWQQVGKGETVAQIVADLQAGGMITLTRGQLQRWMRECVPEALTEDPFGGERDETRRAERLDQWAIKAAETIPGAAELTGFNRFLELAEGEPERYELMREIVTRLLDFFVPELVYSVDHYVNTVIVIPREWTWKVWDDGSRRVLNSVLALFDEGGNLAALHMRTRPRGMPYQGKRPHDKYSTWLRIRRATHRIQADKAGVGQRVIQAAQEFRCSRHGRIPQKALAHACDRTKQAISHQRLLLWDKVQAATGGRAISPGLRNLASRAQQYSRPVV